VSSRRGPFCAGCRVQRCDDDPAVAAEGVAAKPLPADCPMRTDPELLATVEAGYAEDGLVRRMATESARTEAAGYGRATRVEEIMDFARRMGWRRLGIAHCVGLMQEAKAARDIFVAGGFEVCTVCCKVGAVDKTSVGLTDDEKVHAGRYEALCNPVAQAAVLAKAGTEFNVLMGLCVGHDSLFFMHSQAPTTVLVVKDRVLGHNPIAALYTSHSYYRRLTQPAAGSAGIISPE
jgi:uncharacterized metal-binding protein